jgi:kynurenine formamidase
MPTLIDLSQEIFHRAPVFPGHPPIQVFPFMTHEDRETPPKISKTTSPVVNSIIFSDHSSTHVDAFSHFSKDLRDSSIATMPLDMFYTEAICLDLSHFPPKGLIEVADIQAALAKHNLAIKPQDTVLLYTDHFRRTFGTPAFTSDWPGISADVARWFGKQQVTAFGVESPGPGIPGISNAEVHRICGEMGYTHYENLVDLHLLIGKGRFRFIAFPLKIRGGTGSPVRAVAVLE